MAQACTDRFGGVGTVYQLPASRQHIELGVASPCGGGGGQAHSVAGLTCEVLKVSPRAPGAMHKRETNPRPHRWLFRPMSLRIILEDIIILRYCSNTQYSMGHARRDAVLGGT